MCTACMRHVYGIDEADIDEADMILAQSKFGYSNVWHKLIIYSVTAGVIFMRNRLEYMFSSLYFRISACISHLVVCSAPS